MIHALWRKTGWRGWGQRQSEEWETSLKRWIFKQRATWRREVNNMETSRKYLPGGGASKTLRSENDCSQRLQFGLICYTAVVMGTPWRFCFKWDTFGELSDVVWLKGVTPVPVQGTEGKRASVKAKQPVLRLLQRSKQPGIVPGAEEQQGR